MRRHPVKAGFSLRGLPTNASLEIILLTLFNCKHFIPQLDRGIYPSFLPNLFKVFFPIPPLENCPGFAL